MLTSFQGEVVNGRLKVNNRKAFDDYIAKLAGEVVVAVGNGRRRRSEDQNGYYWGVVIKLAGQHCGYHPEEMHDAFKMMFLRRETPGAPPTILSTTSMSTVEFSEFVERCRAWCAEQGIVVPDPQPV